MPRQIHASGLDASDARLVRACIKKTVQTVIPLTAIRSLQKPSESAAGFLSRGAICYL
jgi:hypothetical protein